MTKNFLENYAIKTDELGRLIIEDQNLLAQINGASLGEPEFMFTDGACGNSNCVC